MADEQKPTSLTVRGAVEKVIRDLTERYEGMSPNDPKYPLSVLSIGSCMDDSSTILQYFTTAKTNAKGHEDGWAQAMCMTRDMLLLCVRMDDDYKLGLSFLPAVLAQHPLMQKYLKPSDQPTVSVGEDGNRVVTDLAESAPADMQAGVETKH
jgi:hypothetical protein